MRGQLHHIAIQVGAGRVRRHCAAAGRRDVHRQGHRVFGKHGRDGLAAVEGNAAGDGRASQVARPLDEVPAGGWNGGQRHHVAIQVGAGRVWRYRSAARRADVHRQRHAVFGEHRGDSLIAVQGNAAGVGRAGQVAGPFDEVPAGGRNGGQRDHVAIAIGAGRVRRHRAAARRTDVHRQRHRDALERGDQRLVAVHGNLVGSIAVVGHIAGAGAAPTGEGPAHRAGGGGEGHFRAVRIAGLVGGFGHRSAADYADVERIGPVLIFVGAAVVVEARPSPGVDGVRIVHARVAVQVEQWFIGCIGVRAVDGRRAAVQAVVANAFGNRVGDAGGAHHSRNRGDKERVAFQAVAFLARHGCPEGCQGGIAGVVPDDLYAGIAPVEEVIVQGGAGDRG